MEGGEHWGWVGVFARQDQASEEAANVTAPNCGPCVLSTRKHRRASTSTADVFSKQSDGTTAAAHYAKSGVALKPANMDRIQGWAEILQHLGDPGARVG